MESSTDTGSEQPPPPPASAPRPHHLPTGGRRPWPPPPRGPAPPSTALRFRALASAASRASFACGGGVVLGGLRGGRDGGGDSGVGKRPLRCDPSEISAQVENPSVCFADKTITSGSRTRTRKRDWPTWRCGIRLSPAVKDEGVEKKG
jgi:hypothetical protein